MAWANFSFMYIVPLSKVRTMLKISQFFLFKWICDLWGIYKIHKERKRTAYCEKRWEMKLRGLK